MKNRATDLVLIFAIALAFYGATLAPTVIWSDSAGFAREVITGGALQLGTASDHPLYVAIGRLLRPLPFELAWLLNLESAIFGALAVMMVYRCGRQLGGPPVAAAMGAAALAVSQAFWLHSVIAEVYSANAFFLAATLSLLLDWERGQRWRDLAAAALVFAVGLTNHLVLAAVLPGALIFVAATRPRTFLTIRTVGVAVAAVVVLAVVVVASPSLAAAARKVWIGPPGIREYLSLRIDPGPTAREAGYYLLFFAYQFPSLALPLGVIGIRALLRDRPAAAALLLLTVAVNAGTFIRQTGFQSAGTGKFVFYISDYVVFGVFVAVGATEALAWLTRRSRSQHRVWGLATLATVAMMPPAVYATVPVLAHAAGVDLVKGSRLPYRDNHRFFLNPNKHGEDGARRFATEAFQVAKPRAVIFADATPYEVLRYLQLVEHVRPDVLVRSPRFFDDLVKVEWVADGKGPRPIYVARLAPEDYDLTRLGGGYQMVAAGPIFEVISRQNSTKIVR
jgi:hypothetical protein